jgi:cytochrome c peroxidase
VNRLRTSKLLITLAIFLLAAAFSAFSGRAQGWGGAGGFGPRSGAGNPSGAQKDGQFLFENETFGGNGRTCSTCHGAATGTVSPEDAQARFRSNPQDPLFLHDGSDDRQGNGVYRMLKDATILVEIPLPPNVSLGDDLSARSVILARGVPSTLNTPALDPVLMMDGRQPNLKSQASGALHDHYQTSIQPGDEDLNGIAQFQLTPRFFSSPELQFFASHSAHPPALPQGVTDSEKRGRRFFEDAPFNPVTKAGSCAACHSGPMLNQTNQFLPIPVPPGSRFQDVLVSEFNAAGNPVREFIFRNPDGTVTRVNSPDPGRALITGDARSANFDSVNAFKIPSLWGVRRTAPYFHDNSAKTLEDVVRHYDRFFATVFGIPANGAGPFFLTAQDQADMVAYMKLLN